MSPVIPLRPKRELQTPCYTPQTLSSTQAVIIYLNSLNIMPLTNFYNFLGCIVPTISSCTLKDDSNIDHSLGISLDIANQNIQFLAETNDLGNQYWTNPAWMSGKTFTLTCKDAGNNVYASNSFILGYR